MFKNGDVWSIGNLTYCWWKISQATTWDGAKTPVNNGINHVKPLVQDFSQYFTFPLIKSLVLGFHLGKSKGLMISLDGSFSINSLRTKCCCFFAISPGLKWRSFCTTQRSKSKWPIFQSQFPTSFHYLPLFSMLQFSEVWTSNLSNFRCVDNPFFGGVFHIFLV